MQNTGKRRWIFVIAVISTLLIFALWSISNKLNTTHILSWQKNVQDVALDVDKTVFYWLEFRKQFARQFATSLQDFNADGELESVFPTLAKSFVTDGDDLINIGAILLSKDMHILGKYGNTLPDLPNDRFSTPRFNNQQIMLFSNKETKKDFILIIYPITNLPYYLVIPIEIFELFNSIATTELPEHLNFHVTLQDLDANEVMFKSIEKIENVIYDNYQDENFADLAIHYHWFANAQYADGYDSTIASVVKYGGSIVVVVIAFFTLALIKQIKLLADKNIQKDLIQRQLDATLKILTDTNVNLEQKVTERTLALSETNHELKRTMEKLVQSEKLASLGHLVSGIAHELNTPLGNVKMAVSVLDDVSHNLQGALRTNSMKRRDLELYLSDITDALQLIKNNNQRAVQLIVDFKKINIDSQTLELCRFDMIELINETVRALQYNHQIEHVDIRVLNKLPDNICNNYRILLAQVLTNLLENAVVHGVGKNSGWIEIILEPNNNMIEITISDSGKGIEVNKIERIFDPFYTSKMGLNSGLGLYVVHNLITVQLHGEIRVKNNESGGASFTIYIPQNID